MCCLAGYSKGQMKIQQMAFVLIAIVIFFAMVAIVYFSIRVSNIRESAVLLREEEAKELVRKLAGTPEFMSTECANCIDLDKIFILKDKKSYDEFWDLKYLAVEIIYPVREEECDNANYPDCRRVTLIEEDDIGIPYSAFVSVCRWDSDRYIKCELGKIYASGEGIE